MRDKKKMKLKKFYFHPITKFIGLTILTILLSGILSAFEMQATYAKLNVNTNQLESTLVTVENLCNYDGIKYVISNASRNFMSFTTLSTLLISIIGLSVAQASGLIDAFYKRVLSKLSNEKVTFILIFLATISSLINEIGYAILIPLSAMIFKANKRNPIGGIIAAFCGVAFGYGATLFVGSMEVNLISTSEQAARLIDGSYHVGLSSNLYIIIATSIVLSIVGTIVVEKMIIPKLGKYKTDEKNLDKTEELDPIDVEEEEQRKLEDELRERKGFRNAIITSIIIILIFIYMLLPNLPGSGILLDMNETTYLNQLFGVNSYFQDGFTYLVTIFFLVTGIAYGIGAKTIKSDKDLVEASTSYLVEISSLIALLFFASQFIAVFRRTNIATVVTAWASNIINGINFTGIPLMLLVVILIALINLLATTPIAKWTILAPVVVPKLMQANITPQFAQFLLRAGDSMTKGITPVLAYFVLYVGYLNIYNQNNKKPITIGQSIKLIMPYCIVISLTWLAIILIWYVTGLPIGSGVYPTL